MGVVSEGAVMVEAMVVVMEAVKVGAMEGATVVAMAW